MKKILTLSLIFALLVSGVCFAEKCKLKKKIWTPVQTRTENSIEVQDFYNHQELHNEGEKQIGLWFVTFIPNQKGAAHSYFYEAAVLDYGTGKYKIIRRGPSRTIKETSRIADRHVNIMRIRIEFGEFKKYRKSISIRHLRRIF